MSVKQCWFAFSNAHFVLHLNLSLSCRTYTNIPELRNRSIPIIGLYAPDVTEADLENYHKNCPIVQLRPFTVSAYPNYFADLKNYRFKFPTVASVLPEFTTIFYVDASIRLYSIKGETLTDLFKSMETEFAPTGIRMLYQSWHRNFPATHPDMYAFFNVTEKQMKDTAQAASGLYFLNNSPQGWAIINKLIQCALEPKCMAPKGAKVECDYPMLRKNEKAVCHRFDQSALNMRLIEVYGTNVSLYYRGSDMIQIFQLTECSL
uniref:Nucleotide-diphospho-sugar transferase domain-containing protein n=1 Tax=Panagrellus redivivus TaxID=6233 RepID=A0A7E4VMM7_PANRE